VGDVEVVVSVEVGGVVSGISSSDKTLAFATSAKRPDRKSELYEERLMVSRSLGFMERFRSVKRTPEEEGPAIATGKAVVAVVEEVDMMVLTRAEPCLAIFGAVYWEIGLIIQEGRPKQGGKGSVVDKRV